jgi:hypothetical protein
MKKHILLFLLLFPCAASFAQTPLTDVNLQAFYDFGHSRRHVTTTLEMFHGDAWGNTFFFVDFDYNFRDASGKALGPSGAYGELARCLNFWQDTKLGNLSLQVEYDGGLGAQFGGFTINSAFLVGANYFLHSSDFKNTFNIEVLFKKFVGMYQVLPMQFTGVWGCQDIFGLTGLRFSGFVDFWWEGDKCVILSEPQLWYNIGSLFKCPNLNVGGEIEISNNFAGVSGFMCNPCLGFKWVF